MSTHEQKFKKTEIGIVPVDWETCPLGQLATVRGGYSFKSEEYVPNGIPIVRINNVRDGYLDLKETVFWNPKSIDGLEQFLIQEDDILITMTGNIGNVGYAKKIHLPALQNQRVGNIRVFERKKLFPQFLYFQIRTRSFRNELMGKAFGAIQQNISGRRIDDTLVPVAPLPEQKKIAAILSKIQQAIEVQEEIIERHQGTQESIDGKAFHGRSVW
jgi:type I restriction enzyme S subunit